MKAYLVAPMFGLAAASCLAQSNCADFDAAVEMSLKRAALTSTEGIGDNSAPRQTNRDLEIMALYQLISINQTLAAANNCPPRKTPVQVSTYMSEAISCNLALMKGERQPASCEMKNWQGK